MSCRRFCKPHFGLRLLVMLLSSLGWPTTVVRGVDAWEVLAAKREADQERRWTDSEGVAAIAVRLAGGTDLQRRFHFYRRRVGEYGISTLTVFDYPPDARGTAVLRIHEPGGCDKTWIHQPLLGRVRRLPPARLSGRLAGELDPLELRLVWEVGRWRRGEARASLEGTTKLKGKRCDVIRVWFKKALCGYGGLRVWIRRGDLVVGKAQLFAGSGDLVKTISFDRVEAINGYPTAVSLRISRPGHAGSSRLTLLGIRYNIGLSSKLFEVGYLEQQH